MHKKQIRNNLIMTFDPEEEAWGKPLSHVFNEAQ